VESVQNTEVTSHLVAVKDVFQYLLCSAVRSPDITVPSSLTTVSSHYTVRNEQVESASCVYSQLLTPAATEVPSVQ
jgi:hypothetical protein